MVITNLTRHTEVAHRVRIAESFWSRLKGLIGSLRLSAGEGLLLPNCMGIHMFGMNYPIDAIYLDRNHQVLLALESLRPNTFGPTRFNSCAVLELPVGTIHKSKTQIGDALSMEGLTEPDQSSKAAVPILRFF